MDFARQSDGEEVGLVALVLQEARVVLDVAAGCIDVAIKRNKEVIAMMREEKSWASIINATRCSRATLTKLAKRVKQASEPAVS